MAALIAHPFRFTPAGRIATVEQGSQDADALLLQALLMTRLGERPLLPGFGIADPLYGVVERTAIEAGIAAYGPAVEIDSIDVVPSDIGQVRVTITHT